MMTRPPPPRLLRNGTPQMGLRLIPGCTSDLVSYIHHPTGARMYVPDQSDEVSALGLYYSLPYVHALHACF